MLTLKDLKAAKRLHDVAALLGFEPKNLSYILYKKTKESKYRIYEIAKRGGGKRLISAPSPDLSLLQSNLSKLLQNCTAEIEAAPGREDTLAHGFKRQRSIISNAFKHKKRRFVFNIDIKDFFPSINFGRVRGIFIADRNFALHPTVATVLAQIACHDNSLPQGSPCSPVISNLVARILDIRLCKLAAENGCTYSRYADDITFSTNKPAFPEAIAVPLSNQKHAWRVGAEFERILSRSGFCPNVEKTRMQYRDSRQAVTGLVVNRKVNIRAEYRHLIRAMVNRLFKTGRFDFTQKIKTAEGIEIQTTTEGKISQLHGMFGHIDRIDRHNQGLRTDHTSARKSEPELTSKEKLYRRFLLFKEFYIAERPIIVCEGKTDNIYLRYAIKSLAEQYPHLISPARPPERKTSELKIRIFKYTGTSTGEILQINGGTGDFKGLINSYVDELKNFRAPGGANPVILLIDNDPGSQVVRNVAAQRAVRSMVAEKGIARTITRKETFVHVAGNLYLVMTPMIGDADSNIEDCFSSETKQTKINGRTFQPDAKDGAHYDKWIFARDVVEKKWHQIDFSGFKELLDRITAVITAHKAAGSNTGKPFGVPEQGIRGFVSPN